MTAKPSPCHKCGKPLQQGQMMTMGTTDGEFVFYHADGWCPTTPYIDLETP